MTEKPDLEGRVVMVTGASRGLGRALAEAFAGAGANLVLCARGEAALAETAAVAESRGARVVARAADVTDAPAMAALVEAAASKLGAVRVLVNNASILGSRGPLRDQPVEEWRRVLEVNLTGTLIPTRAVLPGMRRAGGGSIINVTSGVGNRPRADWGAYAVSKWGVEGLSYNLALEEKEAGIRVNVVDPGRLRTEMRRAAYPEEDPTAPARPAEATGVFLWLASDESASFTGERFDAFDWR